MSVIIFRTFQPLQTILTQDSTPLFKKISYELIIKRTLEDLYHILQNYDYEIILNHDCEVALEIFNAFLLKEFNLCFPLKTKDLNEKDLNKILVNGYIKGLIKKRQNCFKLLKQLKLSRHNFIRFHNFVTHKIRS